MVLIAAAFIGLLLSETNWTNIAGAHLLWLVAAGALVGFNEEALARGVVLVGLREGGHSETCVLIMTSFLLGLMHLPNALIGLPLAGAAIQVVFAGIMGAAFYVVRRTTGLLLIQIVIHGLWDLVSFSHNSSGMEAHALQSILQFAVYGLAFGLRRTSHLKNERHNDG